MDNMTNIGIDKDAKEVREHCNFTNYEIWQIKDEFFEEYAFLNSEIMTQRGLSIDPQHYEQVFADSIDEESMLFSMNEWQLLENLFRKFNISHPANFKGHSMSVSDIVVLKKENLSLAYFVEPVGYKEVPSFLEEEEQLHFVEITETLQLIVPVRSKTKDTAIDRVHEMYRKCEIELTAEACKETRFQIYGESEDEIVPSNDDIATSPFVVAEIGDSILDMCIFLCSTNSEAAALIQNRWQECCNALYSNMDASVSDPETYHEDYFAQIVWENGCKHKKTWICVLPSSPSLLREGVIVAPTMDACYGTDENYSIISSQSGKILHCSIPQNALRLLLQNSNYNVVEGWNYV